MRPRVVRSAMLILVGTLLQGSGAPAQAAGLEAPLDVVNVGVPQMTTTAGGGTAVTLCASGALRRSATAPLWESSISGQRVAGLPVGEAGPIGTGTSYSHCFNVDKQGAVAGDVTLVFSYNGVGGDVPSVLIGRVTWVAGDDYVFEMDQ